MIITKQQFEQAADGQPVEIEHGDKTYLLISREMFDQLFSLRYEELNPAAVYPSLLEAWDSVGSPADATDFLEPQ